MNTEHLITLEKPVLKMIARSDIKGISTLEVEGRETYLGELRNFKNLPFLESFLPHEFSIGWVKLPSGETLDPHFHPCSSLIIVTKGEGVSLGDSELLLEEGDIVHIPAWNLHGFKGTGEYGFEGLSIQFQQTAIFESKSAPETTYMNRELIPLKDRELVIFRRKELKSINSVSIGNEKRNLGIVKNFRSNSKLKNILPEKFSAAWVHLGSEEELLTHKHDEKSIILIANGEGQTFYGETTYSIKTGDGVFVPSNAVHGFKGVNGGFWGLSIQFSSTSLYENPEKPRVEFLSAFQKLKLANQKKFEELGELPIFKIPTKSFVENSMARQTLLDSLQVMSRNFQTLMFARVALAGTIEYKKVYMEHLLDELGHDTDLEKERGDTSQELWDPILEASTSWFLSQNHIIDDPKRIIMVSMVLEKCAGKFYGHFANVLKDDLKSEHIEKHCDVDPYHENLGVNLIEESCHYRLEEYIEFQNKAWDMINLYIKRKGELVLDSLSVP